MGVMGTYLLGDKATNKIKEKKQTIEDEEGDW
jgi:hypothetical protein